MKRRRPATVRSLQAAGGVLASSLTPAATPQSSGQYEAGREAVGLAVTGAYIQSATGSGGTGGRPTLAVYVEAGCAACRHARELAERARREIPAVQVKVVDIGVSSEGRPDAVFAVPTFTLDGEVISLGTPSWDGLASRLGVALGDRDAGADEAGGAA